MAMLADPNRSRLYLISPPQIELPSFLRTFEATLDAGDVACFQLRLKPAEDKKIMEATAAILPLCQKRQIEFLINDRADLAKKLSADGVHVGQDDMGAVEARKILGPEATVGVTCHDSRHLAFVAGEGGASYVAFGAFYSSPTKQILHYAKPEILTWWSQISEIPCVAIGGITAENAPTLAKAGAHFVAVSSAIWKHPSGSAAAVAAFDRALND